MQIELHLLVHLSPPALQPDSKQTTDNYWSAAQKLGAPAFRADLGTASLQRYSS